MILQKSFIYADLLLKKHLLLSTLKTIVIFFSLILCEQRLFETELFCNTIHFFAVTFHKFKVLKLKYYILKNNNNNFTDLKSLNGSV